MEQLAKETEAYIRVSAWLKKYGCEDCPKTTIGSIYVFYKVFTGKIFATMFAPDAIVKLDEFLDRRRNDVVSIEYSIYPWIAGINLDQFSKGTLSKICIKGTLK